MLRIILIALALLAGILVIIGFLGSLHRSTDTIGIGRPIFGMLTVVGIFAARAFWLKLFFSATFVTGGITAASFYLPHEPGGDLSIYSKNLWFANSEIPALVADIEAAQVDVVMLQEVSNNNNYVLDLLEEKFPFQHLCKFSGWSGIALASRHPFDGDLLCSEWRAVAVAPIKFENERVWLVSTHLPWPWPFDSADNDAAAESVLAGLEGAVVIAGDFNIMPWSGRAERISSITNTQLAGPVRPTLSYRRVPLPLDFAMAPGGGSVELRPLLGSDHAGIVANLKLW